MQVNTLDTISTITFHRIADQQRTHLFHNSRTNNLSIKQIQAVYFPSMYTNNVSACVFPQSVTLSRSWLAVQVKEELAEVRIVAEGALARRSVLEAQIKRTREQVRALVEKSEQDDALVTTLHGKLASGAAGCGPLLCIPRHLE